MEGRDWRQEIQTGREEVKESQEKQGKRLPTIEIGLAAHIADLKKHASLSGAHAG
jgi:hypothetical protein